MSAPARARLFVAMDLPELARAELHAWARRVAGKAGEGELRPVPAESLHATLCFLGWRDEADAEEIAALALGAVAPGAPGPRHALGAPAWLPRRRPRALAVDLTDEGRRLADLQARISDALAAGVAFEPETRAFRPHVTVARVPRRARVRARDELPAPAPLEFDGAAVTLYRSRLSPAGARYEALARAPLPGG